MPRTGKGQYAIFADSILQDILKTCDVLHEF